MQYRRQRATAALALLAAFSVSALLYPSLPETMVTHWGAGGSANGTTSRFWGAFFTPLLATGVVVLLLVAPSIDPRRQNIAEFRDLYEWLVAGIAWFLTYVHGLTLAWNLGSHVPIVAGLTPALAVLFYGVGVLLDRARTHPNWTVGVRTPWTLDDDTVWERTHERASTAFKLGALLTLVGVLRPRDAIWFVLAGVLLPAAYTVAYSYWLYHRRHAE